MDDLEGQADDKLKDGGVGARLHQEGPQRRQECHDLGDCIAEEEYPVPGHLSLGYNL